MSTSEPASPFSSRSSRAFFLLVVFLGAGAFLSPLSAAAVFLAAAALGFGAAFACQSCAYQCLAMRAQTLEHQGTTLLTLGAGAAFFLGAACSKSEPSSETMKSSMELSLSDMPGKGRSRIRKINTGRGAGFEMKVANTCQTITSLLVG